MSPHSNLRDLLLAFMTGEAEHLATCDMTPCPTLKWVDEVLTEQDELERFEARQAVLKEGLEVERLQAELGSKMDRAAVHYGEVIERLQGRIEAMSMLHDAEVERLQRVLQDADAELEAEREARPKLEAEVERLQGIIDQHDGPGYTYELDKALAEAERLRARVVKAQEVALAWGDGNNDKMQVALLDLFLLLYGQAPRAALAEEEA